MTTRHAGSYTLIATSAAVLMLPTFALAQAPPDEIELTGIVRDFREWNEPGGHIDFDANGRGVAWVGCGWGVYVDNVEPMLGSDRKPVHSGGGYLIVNPWRDSHGRAIYPGLYNAAAGDSAGLAGCSGTGGIESAASFDQWYRDIPGVNMSAPLSLKLVRQPDGRYVFDDKDDPLYSSKVGSSPSIISSSAIRRSRAASITTITSPSNCTLASPTKLGRARSSSSSVMMTCSCLSTDAR